LSVASGIAPPDDDPVARARALRTLVRAHAAKAEADANPVGEVVRAFVDAGLYLVCVPACYGGYEAGPATTIEVIEAISEADGATGWALMIGIETVGLGLAWLPSEAAEHLLAETPRPVFAGALNPRGVARAVPGGYQVSGQWPFASGCMHADYFWGMCVNHDDPNDLLEVIVPRADYEVLPTWQVNGLRGSGSHDVAVTDLFVPDARVTRTRGRKPVHQGTLFRLPPYSRLAYNKVGVSLGIARAAIDAFVELCNEKTPRLASGLLRDRPRAQRAVAEAEAVLRAARAFVLDACDQQWQTVAAGGRSDRHERALVRLACSHACQEAARAVAIVCTAAGTSPNPVDSVLGRCARDVVVVPQQIMVAPHFIEDAGRVLLGLEPLEPAF
jgi:alkylation response protein AidB-like acyl-CoA dehydrogenase